MRIRADITYSGCDAALRHYFEQAQNSINSARETEKQMCFGFSLKSVLISEGWTIY